MSATTGVPASITTPDTVRSRLRTLEFRDGAPSQETAERLYDHLDRPLRRAARPAQRRSGDGGRRPVGRGAL
jgi:hypothetical protein